MPKNRQTKKPAKSKAPPKKMLGKGLARKAGEAASKRNKKTEDVYKKLFGKKK